MSFKEALNSGKFVVTAEAGPPKGTDIKKIVHEVEMLKGKVDAASFAFAHNSCRMNQNWKCAAVFALGGILA